MDNSGTSGRRAFVFPGQGTVGGELSPELAELVGEATGGGEVPYQVSVFAGSAQALHGLRKRGVGPVAVAGHSLGEYSAAYAAGALSLEEALRLVAERDRLMNEASEANPGTMTALLLADPREVEAAVGEVSGVVVVANYNTPRQTVISGEAEAVEAAAGKVSRGKKVPLQVKGAFHSELMREASERMHRVLDEAEVHEPVVPFISGIDARSIETARELRAALQEQMLSPVRWVEVVNKLEERGVETLIEVGEGGTLIRMLKDFKGSQLVGVSAAEVEA